MEKIPILLDFEFTGLDNTFVTDNEIVQMKAMLLDGNSFLCNFYSKKPLCAYSFRSHRVERYSLAATFSKEIFDRDIAALIGEGNIPEYHGFSTSQDIAMLKKYGIEIKIIDLREQLQKSEFETRISTEGSGLEDIYFIVTGFIKEPSHNGIEELHLIKELYEKVQTLKINKFHAAVPYGHCAGMPILSYIARYRRAADGYRYNNSDSFSDSLTNAIDIVEQEREYYSEEDDEEDFFGDDEEDEN